MNLHELFQSPVPESLLAATETFIADDGDPCFTAGVYAAVHSVYRFYELEESMVNLSADGERPEGWTAAEWERAQVWGWSEYASALAEAALPHGEPPEVREEAFKRWPFQGVWLVVDAPTAASFARGYRAGLGLLTPEERGHFREPLPEDGSHEPLLRALAANKQSYERALFSVDPSSLPTLFSLVPHAESMSTYSIAELTAMGMRPGFSFGVYAAVLTTHRCAVQEDLLDQWLRSPPPGNRKERRERALADRRAGRATKTHRCTPEEREVLVGERSGYAAQMAMNQEAHGLEALAPIADHPETLADFAAGYRLGVALLPGTFGATFVTTACDTPSPESLRAMVLENVQRHRARAGLRDRHRWSA